MLNISIFYVYSHFDGNHRQSKSKKNHSLNIKQRHFIKQINWDLTVKIGGGVNTELNNEMFDEIY